MRYSYPWLLNAHSNPGDASWMRLNMCCGFSCQVKAFLNQRLIELRNEDTVLATPCANSCPLGSSAVFSWIIEPVVVDIYLAISLLTNRISRDLNSQLQKVFQVKSSLALYRISSISSDICIIVVKRCLDRLVSELEEKKHREAKLRESLKDHSIHSLQYGQNR